MAELLPIGRGDSAISYLTPMRTVVPVGICTPLLPQRFYSSVRLEICITNKSEETAYFKQAPRGQILFFLLLSREQNSFRKQMRKKIQSPHVVEKLLSERTFTVLC